MNSADSKDVELDLLIELFYPAPNEFGRFSKIRATEMPTNSRKLLAHEHHMTVTVEQFHGCPVDVQVLQSRMDGDHYSRKIVLTRQSDNQVVMFGIVRLDLSLLTEPVRIQVKNQDTPLGRILIAHDVLRVVRLVDLFEIVPGTELAGWLFGFDSGSQPTNLTREKRGRQLELQPAIKTADQILPAHCYGRTALIYCDGRPAIELLEIVSETCIGSAAANAAALAIRNEIPEIRDLDFDQC